MARKTLYLVDGPNMVFRAHYAIRALSNSRGEPTNALFGFASMMIQLIETHRPDYMAIAWDPPGDVFRNERFPAYKATRSETPEDLKKQFPRFPDLIAALGLRRILVDRFEADDVIGTLCARHRDEVDITIVSGDKDMMQLVDHDGHVTILDTMKDLRAGPAEVKQRWGVPPERIIDMLALMGDSSDNIPGVSGIGEKGAADLINMFGGIDEIFARKAEITGRNRKPMLAEGAEASARLSYELATIKVDVPFDDRLADLAVHFPPPDRKPITALLKDLEFHRMLSKFGGEMEGVSRDHYRCVLDEASFEELLAELRAAPILSLDTETTSILPTRADLVGMSFCAHAERAWYLPLGHTGAGSEQQLPREGVLERLRPILSDPARQLVGQHHKYDLIVLERAGLRLSPLGFDTMLGDYLLNPTRRTHDLDGLAMTWLEHKMIPYEETTKAYGGAFAPVPIDIATRYAAEDAHIAWLLREKMVPELERQGLTSLLVDLEQPLVPVLAGMERAGIGLDAEALLRYSGELEVDIRAAEARCWDLAGEQFNTASPKQLATILFEKLGLPVVKKTKTGPSTDADVLEELAAEHDLPAAILRFRTLSKLKSTYVDALPAAVDPATGRVHTSYHQAVAATGRLSSTDPNLQNIPIRTSEGRRIRAAFVARPGYTFLSADYSQIELRVLAHLCGGQGGFARAFAENKDVHRVTAAEIFDVHEQLVTSEMRRTAKAINFGLVYGQTAHGLSRALRVPQKAAKAYIERYKARYPEIDGYMARTVAFAEAHGWVETILHRRRQIPDLDSPQFTIREAARRTAINTPVQGSAADLIKLAMLRVDRGLKEELPDCTMLLQVHDELVFEVPQARAGEATDRIRSWMQDVHTLLVPLVVDVGQGPNWDAAHGG